MEDTTATLGNLAASSKGFVRRLMTISENRLELLTLEVQEGRERLLQAFLLALGVAAFGLLGGITLTAAIVVWLWPYSHTLTLFVLTAVYGVIAAFLANKLNALFVDWQLLSASLDQLRKDRECLEKILD